MHSDFLVGRLLLFDPEVFHGRTELLFSAILDLCFGVLLDLLHLALAHLYCTRPNGVGHHTADDHPPPPAADGRTPTPRTAPSGVRPGCLLRVQAPVR